MINTLWHYQMTQKTMHLSEIGPYLSYGIQVRQNTGFGWTVCRQIYDITTELQHIRSLVESFNALQLSPIHLEDVLEDALP